MDAKKFLEQLNQIVDKFRADAEQYGVINEEMFDLDLGRRILCLRVEVKDENENTVVVYGEVLQWGDDGLDYYISHVEY